MTKLYVYNCPVCFKEVAEELINAHLDTCVKRSPKRSRRGHASSQTAVCPSLRPQARVRICPPQSRPDLNPQEGQLLEYQESNGHWKVLLANGKAVFAKEDILEEIALEKQVKQEQVTLPTPMATSSGHGTGGPELLHVLRSLQAEVDWDKNPEATRLLAKQVQEWKDLQHGSLASIDDLTASFEVMEAHLSNKKQRAVVDLSCTLATAATQVAHWCEAVREHSGGAADRLEAYERLGSPTTYEEQCERNRLRAELRHEVKAIGEALEKIHQAAGEPGARLEGAEGSVLGQLGSSIERLRRLLEEARGLFQAKRAEVQEARDSSSAILADLWPHIDRMDGFVRLWARELAGEAAEAQGVHRQRLEQLREEEARYVRANDSPQRNQTFAKVREDIQSTLELLEDKSKQDQEQEAFRSWWEALMSKMPSKKVPEQQLVAADPPKVSRKRKWGWW
mmetsp:Transcript_20421/g.48326  ORF Transcript_20421/g.48326 Transcript_20421/m.48326 type:complete len:452 (-) Transcript_20421:221-1576(-)